jgi:HlyD family secretion protein
MTRLAAALYVLLAALAVSACQREENHAWLGYADGETALIAPPQPGWLTSIAVARGAHVKSGDVLFTLDTVRETAAQDNAVAAIAAAKAQGAQAEAQAAQAAAQRAQAEAQVVSTQKELDRQQALVRIGGTAQRDVETAQAAFDSARASRAQTDAQRNQALAARDQAEAQVKELEANLVTAGFNVSERRVTSRVNGQVQDVYYRQGEYANAGAPVVAILPPANIYVRFFVPEPELQKLKLGDRVHIGCDGCPANLTATIGFIASEAEFTPPIIYSVGNREKLVFKLEARAPGGLKLNPGQPVEVRPL